jgi:hypothetical protein
MAGSYTAAQAIVEALEREGIVGTRVEVVSGADDDISSAGKANSGDKKGLADKIRNIFRSDGHSGHNSIPDYGGDPEFYASHVRQGRALIIVRMPDVPEADRAAEVLRLNGAFDPRGGEKPRIVWENDQPGANPSFQPRERDKTMDDDTLTTGGTRADLEGRGTNIRKAD